MSLWGRYIDFPGYKDLTVGGRSTLIAFVSKDSDNGTCFFFSKLGKEMSFTYQRLLNYR
jgi:hypothetical protein